MNRMMWILIIAIVLLGAGGWYVLTLSSTHRPQPSNQNSGPFQGTIIMNDGSFQPSRFTVRASTTIKVLVKNTGKKPHSFTFNLLDLTSGRISPGQSKTLIFTTPSAGEYEFYSDPTGVYPEPGMTGTMAAQ